jgi:hypothetical protein
MSIHYCHRCAAELGHLRQPERNGLIGTTYQLEKYIKHTVPDPKYPVQSVFSSPSTSVYASFVLETMAAGSLELDDSGRKNVIWAAGEPTGFMFNRGVLVQPQDAVKVVLSTSTGEIHAFPANSTTFFGATCVRCGAPIIY